jgi:xanthine dehydrogenase accessory factor
VVCQQVRRESRAEVKDVLKELSAWRIRGDQIALATVVKAPQSAPRPPGAKLAINERGEVAGSLSDGRVEGAVIEVAKRVLAGEPPRLMQFGIADPDPCNVGVPCGGEIDVWVQAYDKDHTDPSLEDAARYGGRLAEVTLLEGARPGAKLVVAPDGVRDGTLGPAELDTEAVRLASELMWREASERRGGLFIDVVAPPPRLILFGAVDLAAALCRLARAAGWRPFVVDPRARFATAARYPEAELVVAAWPEEAFQWVGGIDPATSIVVLGHDSKLEDCALTLALRSPARFVGAVGSRVARHKRLLALGLGQAEFGRLVAPIGLDLGAVGQEETALSILAEIVAVRRAREGGRLRDSSGTLHEVAVGAA